MPVKCGELVAGSNKKSCVPVLQEESLNPEISWGTIASLLVAGTMSLKVTKSFQFLLPQAVAYYRWMK